VNPPHLPDPILIEADSDLARLVDEVGGEAHVGLDTESNSLYACREQVCLIQLSTRERDYLIDPLVVDVVPLGALTADPKIEKVFHAAEYDVMCLRRDFGFRFAGLFDTMLAARILGRESFGLAAMLKELFGIRVSKGGQRANWGRRPLTRSLMRYAQTDTHYLLPLRDRMHAELAQAGRLEEAREAFDEVAHAEWKAAEFDPNDFWKINGAFDLSPCSRAVLRELYIFRQEQAQLHDRPPFKVMGDATLSDLARRLPRSMGEVADAYGMTVAQVRRYGKGVLCAVERGLASDPPRSPDRSNHVSHVVLERYEALHAWRKRRAATRGVLSDVIVSRDALWELAQVAPRTPDQLANLRSLGPWKRKTYGQEILRVLESVDGGSR
jgi:ribonuclease D